MLGSLTSGLLCNRLRENSRRVCNPQFYVSGKRPMTSSGYKRLPMSGVVCKIILVDCTWLLMWARVDAKMRVRALPIKTHYSLHINVSSNILRWYEIALQLFGWPFLVEYSQLHVRMHICVSESSQYWLRQWLAAYLGPSHYLLQLGYCQLDP